jgi:hypothetical protein
MAKLELISNVSWKQPFKDRKKELLLWGTHKKVAEYCNFKNGTKRLLNIKFESKFNIDITQEFQITSGLEISFPRDLIQKIQHIVFNNPDSYFTVSVLDTFDISYSSSDIIWIKNVKPKDGKDWAYKDEDFENTFLLNWPTSKRGSAETPNVGDIIVLFQKPNYVNGLKNSLVYFTHLVTPISEKIIEDKKNDGHKWCREVRLIAKPENIDGIPQPGFFNFFKPNRGLTNPIVNLENNIGLDITTTKNLIWSLFDGSFNPNIAKLTLDIDDTLNQDYEVLEGDKQLREHIKLERSKRAYRIIELAKKLALKKGKGRILCECCQFDFVDKYGEIGQNFIECHHKIFINKGERITKIEDLAMVCSNCHRMLHKRNNKGEYYSTVELKKLLNDKAE